MLRTEYEFTLPCGYLKDGKLHREGVMRRANAADEIEPLKDPRVVKNSAYLVVILLARVITLNGVEPINTKVIEDLYVTDMAYLQNLYNEVNRLENDGTPVICPQCQHEFQPETHSVGGS